jgi:hypothetical protein
MYSPAVDDGRRENSLLAERCGVSTEVPSRGARRRERRPASAMSQENGQSDQQMRQQHHRIFHGQVACAALNWGKAADRRCWAAHFRIRTALRTALRGHPTIRAIRRSNLARSAGVNRRNFLLQQRKAAGSHSRPTTISSWNSPRSN